MRLVSGVSAMLLFCFSLTAPAVCTTANVFTTCCNYTLYDGQNTKDVNYRGPQGVFANASDANTWAKGVLAKMPLYLPYDSSSVSIVQGWLYNDGGSHSGIDSWRSSVTAGNDVTFDVRSVAEGRVVTKIWDNWHGNVLIVEHTATDGSKYRSMYFHLRDGYTHDRNAAKAIVPADPSGNDNVAKYARYAKNNSDKLYWGQESHTIAVKVGDWVNAGQFLAHSGNTGPGGAGAGLNNDGTLTDTTRANNHLHFMLAVPNPKVSGEWVFVDPYGVYEKQSSGCYADMKDIDYPRLFAPFYPNFHNLSWDLFKFYFSYYPNMGWGPQTLSVYKAGGNVRAAGAFHPTIKAPWAARGYLTTAEFSQWFNTYHQQGLRPRELQYTPGQDGQPRFTAIWQKRGSEGYYTWINLSDADFTAKWNDLVTRQGYRIEDYIAYSVAGQRRHAAIFVKDGLSFELWYNMNPNEYSQKFTSRAANGWKNTSFNAADLPWGQRYGGVWMQKPGAWATWFNMTGAGYQQKFEQLSGQGFRLWKVQGYSDGNSFGGIWTK